MTYKITLAFLSPGHVKTEFWDSTWLMGHDPRYEVDVIRKTSGTNVQLARNELARAFVDEMDSDYLFFVDADIAFDVDVPEKLISKDVPIVSALYLGITNHRAFPVGHVWTTPEKLHGVDHEGTAVRSLRQEDILGTDLMEVAGIGMGCCMIRREVMVALREAPREHPYQWPFAVGQMRMASGQYLFCGEDVTFALRAQRAGFTTYLAPDVRVSHAKEFLIGPNGEGPAHMRPADAEEVTLR